MKGSGLNVLLAGSVIWGMTASAKTSFDDHPIVRTSYTSDPAPVAHGGTMYLTTTHDENVAGQPVRRRGPVRGDPNGQ